jgi:hypothetical protein
LRRLEGVQGLDREFIEIFLILSQDLHQYPLDEGYQPSSNGSWGWFKILFLILHEIVVLKTERVNCFKWNKVGIGQDWF